MMVGSVRTTQREWLEPDDVEVVERHPSPSPTPAPPAAPPASAAPSAAPGEASPRSLLDTLPPAAVQPPPSAPPSPSIVAAPTPASTYVGERPADAAWLAARETALVALRADYETARARAQANGGTGPGWTPAVLVTDESGQTFSANGAPLLHITDPNAAPVQVGWDEGGPVYQPDPGTWLEFDEAAFAAAYRAQGGAPLQALAAQYGTDAATLLAQHPDLWAVATTDHALNAGPAPAGVAMGNASQLGMLDLYLADPQIASLVQTYGGSVAPATGGLALEQVRLYGQVRYEQLSRLGNAMQSVRDQYAGALANAAAGGSSAGWTEQEVAVYATDESGQQIGGPTGTTTVRSFDPDAFTAWYVKQDGLANKAFGDFYGLSTTTRSTDESGQTLTSIAFTNPNWSMAGIGGAMTHGQLVGINPNDPPELNNNQAVGFDLEVGWATSPSNIHEDTDWFEIVVKVAIVAAVSYFSAGTLGPEVAGAIGVTSEVGVAVVSAAVAGAATSTVSGVMNDNLTFKGILQGALAGALTAGLTGPGSSLGDAARGVGPGATIALRTTVQGGIQALLGGSFTDGAIAGFASGLASLAGAGIGKGIDDAVKAGSMNAAEAMVARTLARVFTSAVQALGNPNDPNYGFASALVGDVVNQGLDAATQGGAASAPVIQTAFDDEGNLMPGVTNAAAPWSEQLQQLRGRLVAQGMEPATADQVVDDYSQRTLNDAVANFLVAEPDPVLVAGVGWTPDVRSARAVIDSVESRIADGSLKGPEIGRAIDETYQGFLRLSATTVQGGGPITLDQELAATRLLTLIGDLGQLAHDEGQALSPEQEALVRQSRVFDAQRAMPQILGSIGAGGILAARRTAGATRPTGTLGGRALGEAETIQPNADSGTKRGIRLQNDAADTLAGAGYRVEHNPQSSAPGAQNHDVFVEGRRFDVYSPEATTSASNIVSRIGGKLAQADRVVLNLAENPVSRNELRAAFAAGNTGIKEVIVIGPDKVIYRLP